MNQFWIAVAVLSVVSLNSCNSSDSSTSPTSPSAPAVLTPQQQVQANFTRVADDQSYLHNSALKDASGVVWGLSVGSFNTDVTLSNIKLGCYEIGGTLPTWSQLDQLAKYLGRDSAIGFHSEYAQDVVPNTGIYLIWNTSGDTIVSSTLSTDGSALLAMNGDTGEQEEVPLLNGVTQEPVDTLCVFPAQRAQFSCQIRTSSQCTPSFSGSGPVANWSVVSSTNLQETVTVSEADPSGNITLTVELNDHTTNQSANRSVVIGPSASASATVDLADSKSGMTYELSCVAGGVNLQIPTGQACLPIH